MAKFIQESIENETISQFIINSPKLFLHELITFAKEFDMDSNSNDNDIIDSEDEEAIGVALNGLLQRIQAALVAKEQDKIAVEKLEKDIHRMIKMFYLEMRVKG